MASPFLASLRNRPYLLAFTSLLALLLLSSLHRPSPSSTTFQLPGLLPSTYHSSSSSPSSSSERAIWPSPQLLREQERRYAHLRKPHIPGSSRIASGEGKYLFVTLIRNIEDQLPELLDALLVLTKFLGPQRVRFSIYEGPSSDDTPHVIREVLVPMLKELGVPEEELAVKTDMPEINFDMVNRIQALAVLRNEALAPLWTREGWSDTAAVVYFNDVYLRARDVLELLHQHVKAGEKAKKETGVTTGVDWWKRHPEYYYDVWVARTMEGELFYPIEGTTWSPSDQFLSTSPSSREAYDKLRPFQAFSSWAGMAVLAATPFLAPHHTRFRRSDPKAGECAASECDLICRDFWKVGWGRVQVVPSVQLAYERDVAQDVAASLAKTMEDLSWWEETPGADDDHYVEWNKEPPSQVKCYPWPEKLGLDGNVWENAEVTVPYVGYGA